MLSNTDVKSENGKKKLNWLTDDNLEILEDIEEKKPSIEGRVRIKNKLSFEQCILSCQAIKSESIAAVGLCDGRIFLHNITDGNFIAVLMDRDLNKYSSVMAIRFLSEDINSPIHHIMIAIYNSGHIKFWNYFSHICLKTLKEDQEFMDVAINLGNTKLVAVGKKPKLSIYDIETKQIINTLEASCDLRKADGHRMKVFTAKYHPTISNILLSAGWDSTVQFWDDRQKNALRRIYGPHICGKGLDIFEGQILTASWRQKNNLEIWNFDSGKKVREIPSDLHSTNYICCQWLNKYLMITGGSDEHMASLVDCYSWLTVGCIFGLAEPVYCMHAIQNPLVILIGAGINLYITESTYKEKKY